MADAFARIRPVVVRPVAVRPFGIVRVPILVRPRAIRTPRGLIVVPGPVAPRPLGSGPVIYDRPYVSIGGFVGISTPRVHVAIGF